MGKVSDYLARKSKVELQVFQAQSVSENEAASSSVLVGELSNSKGCGLKEVKIPTFKETLISGRTFGAFSVR